MQRALDDTSPRHSCPVTALVVHVVVLPALPLVVVDAKPLRLRPADRVGKVLHHTNVLLVAPRLQHRPALLRRNLDVLVEEEGVEAHPDHESDGAADNDHDGVRGGVRQPGGLEAVLVVVLVVHLWVGDSLLDLVVDGCVGCVECCIGRRARCGRHGCLRAGLLSDDGAVEGGLDERCGSEGVHDGVDDDGSVVGVDDIVCQ
mmetsp:Transcript_20444/g.58115  ORF Transcript_20444/g.58115 Transcript_20444/m.58115 type:complete len:202 (-) Transcript_20444:185-790(-)